MERGKLSVEMVCMICARQRLWQKKKKKNFLRDWALVMLIYSNRHTEEDTI
jgi:hypothetical protein